MYKIFVILIQVVNLILSNFLAVHISRASKRIAEVRIVRAINVIKLYIGDLCLLAQDQSSRLLTAYLRQQ